MEKFQINNWKLAHIMHSDFIKSDCYPLTKEEIEISGFEILDATVPGNFELDFIKAKKLPEDIYFGENILEVQKLESTHLWYFAEFDLIDNGKDAFILFEGIDTAAEIFIDGEFVDFCENMLIPYEFSLSEFEIGKHQVVVHIIPASVYVRDIPFDSNCRGQKYNVDSLLIRKAPYMYGWDIMPRTVSAGLWRPVSIVYKNKDRFEDYRIYTNHIEDSTAKMTADIRIFTDKDDLRDFTVNIKGVCGESTFEHNHQLYSVNAKIHFDIENAKLWWPKNHGEQNLYDTTFTLLYKGEEVDSVTLKVGVRFYVRLGQTIIKRKNYASEKSQ